MHLAILMTNTDESAFAARHPRDGEKFTALIHMVRPDWRTQVFHVKDGLFPEDISRFDGAMITGSPASVQSGAPWIARLLDLIRGMHERRQPLFGACFGHQAIAKALGGEIAGNPGGWVHGLTQNITRNRAPWMQDLADTVHLYGSHCECVSRLPEGARPAATCQGAVSGFFIGTRLYTTQHHPEMSHAFITALTDEMRQALGPRVYQDAMASLAEKADQKAFAESIARFFEQAAS